ncbi:hypothetical protein QFC21_007283 [Naganishia friedmannii]|uniref:Uncharacterized protein n=1 Tax=Naganishia friedmannii TaxID=89922 RepID=A0ACC2UY38_9TREE|nr:hypothetical protein QFC21_007283 [Naganishia friedmannii]
MGMQLTSVGTVSDDDWKQIKAAKRFPDQFKDPMYEVGKKAVELGVVGDALYETLPLIIRYNRFTMKKYVLDKMKDYQTEYYETVKRETLPVLKAAIETTMEKQVLDYNAAQELYARKIQPQMPRSARKRTKLVKREESRVKL